MVKRSRAERTASAGARVAGRGVGTGIGAALSSPFGIAGLGIAAIVILIIFFRKDIGGFLGGLKFPELPSLPDINFPDIKFPDINFPDFSFPDFSFPDFSFPEIKFPELPDFAGLFEQQQMNFQNALKQLGGGFPTIDPSRPIPDVENTGLLPDPTVCACGSTIKQDTKGNVNQVCNICEGGGLPKGTAPFNDAAIFAQDFPEEFIPTGQEAPVFLKPKPKPVSSFLIDQPLQQFTGGGVGFIGGSIFETPFDSATASLSDIIDKFNVSASKAADIKAQAIGFDDTSGFIPEGFFGEPDIIGTTAFNPPAVSDPQFAGLTPEEIALQLTGGNISNF